MEIGEVQITCRIRLPTISNNTNFDICEVARITDQQGYKVKYKDLESVLVEVLDVEPADLGTFRAQLRYFRKLGLPQRLPRTGSGHKIDYTPRQLLELVIAAELQRAGQAPAKIVMNAPSIVRMSPFGQHEGEDVYVCVSRRRRGYKMAHSPEHLSDLEEPKDLAFIVVNVSACVRRLNQALGKLG